MIKDVETGLEEQERVILVGINSSTIDERRLAEEHLDELEMLSNTAGGNCVFKMLQTLPQPNRSYYIGKGKLKELQDAIQKYKVDSVIFDDDLSPSQVRNLERELKTKIIDRSGLILDIFASRARSAASKTQVELAQLQYLLPRLTRYWTHLSRQKGGIGTKGPGETQIETDRRLIGRRISTLKDKLDKLEKQHSTQRKQRSKLTRIAIAGYTNAGKSTLMNALTNTNVLAENKLFATLDATSRAHEVEGQRVVLSDTVGFIRKLPHKLVESFKSTLDEIAEADIILHVVDGSSPVLEDYIKVVNQTFEELDCEDKPTLLVFNKADACTPDRIAAIREEYPASIFISAERGIGLGLLEQAISKMMEGQIVQKRVQIPMNAYKVASILHEKAEILEEKYEEDQLIVHFRIDSSQYEVIYKELVPFLIE